MKVNIGPYIHWWGPYQIFGLLTKLGFNKETTDNWAKNSPEWFHNLCQYIHTKRKRKIEVHVDNYDVWAVDSTLACIVLPLLEDLKKEKKGTPISMFEDADGIDETGNPTEESMAKAIARWELIIDKIIWSFKQVLDEEFEAFEEVRGELDLKKYPEDEGKATVPLRWGQAPVVNWNAYNAYQDHIQEGLDLFGKHYRDLWT